jgi:hypothetical protein
LVGRPPVGSGARAGCGRAAGGSDERIRLPRASHRIVSRLMSSRGLAVNLRPISRSAATAFSLGPGEPARVLVRLPDPAAVSQTHQARHRDPHPSRFGATPRIRVCAPCNRAAASQPHPCCNLPIPTACSVRNRASQVALGGLRVYRHIVCCHLSCPSYGPSSDRALGSSAFPRRTGRQYPDRQCP